MGLLWHGAVIAVGCGVVLACARLVVGRCLSIARHLRLSDEFIGMTVLSVGTSLPEIFTHLAASIRILREPPLLIKLSALSVGANVGSDIFQQNFVLGLVALLGAVSVSKHDLLKDVGGLIVAALVVFAFSIGGTISRIEGALLVAGYVGYLWLLKRHGNLDDPGSEGSGEAGNPGPAGSMRSDIALTLAGFALMAVAADRVLDSAVVVVEQTFASYSFFGLIVLGTATALPELSTSLIAVFRNRAAVSSGILIGSNITNPTFALGLGALMSTYRVPAVIVWYDLPMKIATGALIYAMLRRGAMRRSHAAALIVIFLVYLFIRQHYFPSDF